MLREKMVGAETLEPRLAALAVPPDRLRLLRERLRRLEAAA